MGLSHWRVCLQKHTRRLLLLGGTTNLTEVYLQDNYGNDVQIEYGYSGSLTWLFANRRNATAHIASGSNGIVVYNNTINPTYTPLTAPTVDQFTLTGPKQCNNSVHTDFAHGLLFDHNAGGIFKNGVISGYREYDLYIEDGASVTRTVTGDLNVSYTSIINNGSGNFGTSISPWTGCGTSMTQWMNGTGAWSPTINQLGSFTLGYDASICGDYCSTIPDFQLTEASTIMDAEDSETLKRGVLQYDASFTWTEVCPQNNAYCAIALLRPAPALKGNLLNA